MTPILKGAFLFDLLNEQSHRPTRDADFLSIRSSNSLGFVASSREIEEVPADGGCNVGDRFADDSDFICRITFA